MLVVRVIYSSIIISTRGEPWKKNFFGIEFDLLGNCILKSREGRLNPQNMKKNGQVVFEKIVFGKKYFLSALPVSARPRHDEVVDVLGCMV